MSGAVERRAAVRALAGGITPPPCFGDDRAMWVSWLEIAAQAQASHGQTVVLLVEQGKPRLNPAMNFCADCTREYAASQERRGKCRPSWVADQLNNVVEAACASATCVSGL